MEIAAEAMTSWRFCSSKTITYVICIFDFIDICSPSQSIHLLVSFSQTSISSPPLGRREPFQRLDGLLYGPEVLRQLAPLHGTDATPMAHEPHGPEEVALDHEGVEPGHAVLRIDPAEHDDGCGARAEVICRTSPQIAATDARDYPGAALRLVRCGCISARWLRHGLQTEGLRVC